MRFHCIWSSSLSFPPGMLPSTILFALTAKLEVGLGTTANSRLIFTTAQNFCNRSCLLCVAAGRVMFDEVFEFDEDKGEGDGNKGV